MGPLLLGIAEQLRRRGGFEHLALMEEVHAVGNVAGEAHFVGGEHHGHAPLGEVTDHGEDLTDQFGIERRSDLVQQEDLGIGHQGPHDCSPLLLTSAESRRRNGFTWFPSVEVAKLFAGIFLTIIPAIAILKAGTDGALSVVVAAVSQDGEPVNMAYFWLTGILSSFLDNAPTYLVFFNTAGGDPQVLMGPLAQTLLAISAGAVFMGANTYIGNAPNFMVRAIAEERGIPMPSFFGYMIWSSLILLPIFALVSWIFFL